MNIVAVISTQDSEVSGEFFHPCEKSMVREIVRCGDLHRSVKRFVLKYSSQAGQSIGGTDTDGDANMPRGLYLQALADSIDTVLDPFRHKLYDLVEHHIRNPNYSINYFHMQIKEFEPFFQFLLNFIAELQTTKQYHGCAILKLLHKHNFNGDPKIMAAIRSIRKHVYAIWLRQLSQWLIYGRLVDVHDEFFIVHSETNRVRNVQSTVNHSTGSTYATVASDAASVNADLWHYEVCYEMLPPYCTPSWAEKVLFIGQTVRMLNSDPRKATKQTTFWNDDGVSAVGAAAAAAAATNIIDDDGDVMEVAGNSLWNKQEHIYFNKLQALYNDDSVDIGAYESIVNEIKTYVTERLSEIAFNQADLIMHLRLVKDYYLLGRGELFLEFINQMDTISTRDGITEHLARDVSRAFQVALNRSFIDLEQLTLCMPLTNKDVNESHNGIDTDDDDHQFLRFIQLKFKVKWPLHLFFSPLILKRYNELFRFLLQIRKLQNDLHAVWRLHRERKIAGNSTLVLLRNKLLFLVDNLQYYLQVDVLESQFSILIAAVQNSKDFEYIQRAHGIFQANIMSLCFLLNTNVADASHLLLNATMAYAHTKPNDAENPVLSILKNIMRTIRTFCKLNASCSVPLTHDEQQQLELNDRM